MHVYGNFLNERNEAARVRTALPGIHGRDQDLNGRPVLSNQDLTYGGDFRASVTESNPPAALRGFLAPGEYIRPVTSRQFAAGVTKDITKSGIGLQQFTDPAGQNHARETEIEKRSNGLLCQNRFPSLRTESVMALSYSRAHDLQGVIISSAGSDQYPVEYQKVCS